MRENMSNSTTMISGFGVDIKDNYEKFFTSFLNNYFDGSIEDNEQIIELWYMQKNGYEVPSGPYVTADSSDITPEWKSYHKLLASERKHFKLSLNIYGSAYEDDGLYLVLINETVVEKNKIGKSDLDKSFSQEALNDLEEFVAFFHLEKPDWHIVSLTC